MPDLTIHTASMCRSCIEEEFDIEGHRVVLGPSNGKYQYDWCCDCKGYQFRRTCRHIEAAKKAERCRWNEGMEPTAHAEWVDGEARCPVCGGPVVTFNVGV